MDISRAREIAAQWQSPGTVGRVLAQFASTGTAGRIALRDDIDATLTHDKPTGDDWVQLNALREWVDHELPTRYARIVFLQGEEADEVLDKLERWEGGNSVVYHGHTDETVAAAVEHLAQWDFGDESEHDVHDEPAAGPHDRTETVGDYVMSWNLGLSYVGLERKVD